MNILKTIQKDRLTFSDISKFETTYDFFKCKAANQYIKIPLPSLNFTHLKHIHVKDIYQFKFKMCNSVEWYWDGSDWVENGLLNSLDEINAGIAKFDKEEKVYLKVYLDENSYLCSPTLYYEVTENLLKESMYEDLLEWLGKIKIKYALKYIKDETTPDTEIVLYEDFIIDSIDGVWNLTVDKFKKNNIYSSFSNSTITFTEPVAVNSEVEILATGHPSVAFSVHPDFDLIEKFPAVSLDTFTYDNPRYVKTKEEMLIGASKILADWICVADLIYDIFFLAGRKDDLSRLISGFFSCIMENRMVYCKCLDEYFTLLHSDDIIYLPRMEASHIQQAKTTLKVLNFPLFAEVKELPAVEKFIYETGA